MGKLDSRRARKKLDIAQRRLKVAELWRDGLTEAQIAKRVGASQPTVHTDLVALKEGVMERAGEAHDERWWRELADLEAIRNEAIQGFRRSRMPHAKGLPERPGDPRFLERWHKTVISKLELLGALRRDAGNKLTINNVNWGDMLQRGAPAVDPIDAKLRELEAMALPHREVIDVVPQGGHPNGAS